MVRRTRRGAKKASAAAALALLRFSSQASIVKARLVDGPGSPAGVSSPPPAARVIISRLPPIDPYEDGRILVGAQCRRLTMKCFLSTPLGQQLRDDDQCDKACLNRAYRGWKRRTQKKRIQEGRIDGGGKATDGRDGGEAKHVQMDIDVEGTTVFVDFDLDDLADTLEISVKDGHAGHSVRTQVIDVGDEWDVDAVVEAELQGAGETERVREDEDADAPPSRNTKPWNDEDEILFDAEKESLLIPGAGMAPDEEDEDEDDPRARPARNQDQDREDGEGGEVEDAAVATVPDEGEDADADDEDLLSPKRKASDANDAAADDGDAAQESDGFLPSVCAPNQQDARYQCKNLPICSDELVGGRRPGVDCHVRCDDITGAGEAACSGLGWKCRQFILGCACPMCKDAAEDANVKDDLDSGAEEDRLPDDEKEDEDREEDEEESTVVSTVASRAVVEGQGYDVEVVDEEEEDRDDASAEDEDIHSLPDETDSDEVALDGQGRAVEVIIADNSKNEGRDDGDV